MNDIKEKNTTEEVGLNSLTAYEHLRNMCKDVRNESNSSRGFINPITPRLEYIMKSLASMGISYELDVFDSDNGTLSNNGKKLANVIVKFNAERESIDCTIFSAHHDVMTANSENCQDNTASVCNLLELCSLLQNTSKENLKQNVIVAFTDCEEVGGRGMTRIVKQIDEGVYQYPKSIYALELTANGRNYWIEGVSEHDDLFKSLQESTLEGELNIVRTPYNESMNARGAGLSACCIGILSDTDMEAVKNQGYCGTWGLCHSFEDTFERSANMEDMKHFNETLLRIVTK
tara:strand:- start:14311 stop:15177 length:867 start_codon:yes stop_codon:yes gene_type:complete